MGTQHIEQSVDGWARACGAALTDGKFDGTMHRSTIASHDK